MRPTIVEALNNHFNTQIFKWLIPHGVFLYVLAFVLCLFIFVNRSGKIGLSHSYAFWSGIWAIAFGLIGARIYYLLQHIDLVIHTPSQIFNISGGTGSWGGYIGGTLGFLLSLKLYRVAVLKYLDTAASALGLGIFMGRLSCFLAGCCFGTISSSLPWAVRFPIGSSPYNAQLHAGIITSNAQLSLPIHPVQIYDSLNGLFLFLLTSWYWSRLKKHPGTTFCLFWLSWCITRFGLEFFRGDKLRGFVGPFSAPQFICLLAIVPLTLELWWILAIKYDMIKIGGVNENL